MCCSDVNTYPLQDIPTTMFGYSIIKTGGMFLLLATGVASGAETSFVGNSRKLKAVCRGEEVCLNQVCDPTSFLYEVGNEGMEFPYTITHKSTKGSITFEVCPSKDAKSSCASSSGGCSSLKSVKLRMRNDMLSLGRDLLTEPKGQMWASCSSHGPGHVWNYEELGSLASQSPDTAQCQTFTVITGKDKKKAQLKDICQQDLKIVENSGWTVFDQSTRPNSCLFVLETSNGRVGYTAVGGATVDPKEDAKEEEVVAMEASKDEKETVEISDKDEKEHVAEATAKVPVAYGQRVSAYGQRVAAMNAYGQRAAGVNSYGQRRRNLRRHRVGGRRMF